MKNLFKTLGISLAAFGMAAAVGVGIGAGEMKAASAVSPDITTGASCSKATMNLNNSGAVSAWKLGTSSATGDLSFTIPADATSFTYYAAGWNKDGDNRTIDVYYNGSKSSDDSLKLTNYSAISGSSSAFSISESDLSKISKTIEVSFSSDTTVKLATSSKRAIVWNVTYTTGGGGTDSLSLDIEKILTYVGDDGFELNATADGYAPSSWTWSVEDPSILDVDYEDDYAMFTPLGAGKTTVTVSAPNGTKEMKATCDVTITSKSGLTVEDAFDVEDAILAGYYYTNSTSTDSYYVEGVVSSYYSDKYCYPMLQGANDDFEIYLDCTGKVYVGDTIRAYGKITNFNNKQPEMIKDGTTVEVINVPVSSLEVSNPKSIPTGVVNGDLAEYLDVNVKGTQDREATNQNWIVTSSSDTSVLSISGEDGKLFSTSSSVGNTILTVASVANPSKTKTISIELFDASQPVLQSVAVTGTPTKATQYVGQDFDWSGLTFTPVYEPVKTPVETITGDDIDWNALVAGSNPTGSYTGDGATVTVTVSSVSVEADGVYSVKVEGDLTKKTYDEKDEIDFDGLTALVSYKSDHDTFVTPTSTVEWTSNKTPSSLGVGGPYTIEITASVDSISSTGYEVTGINVTEHETAKYGLYTGEITEGEYVIVGYGEDNTNALNATISNNRFTNYTVNKTDGVIVDPDASAVWNIAKNGNYWTIYNSAAEKYAGGTTSTNQGALLDSVVDLSKWTITMSSNTKYTFENYGRSSSANKYLRNNAAFGWATYANTTGAEPTLYKLGNLPKVWASFNYVSATPIKTNYTVGESFDPAGLEIHARFTEPSLYPEENITNSIVWDVLEEGTTATGSWEGHQVTITGLTISAFVGQTFTKITALDELAIGSEVIFGGYKASTREHHVLSAYDGSKFFTTSISSATDTTLNTTAESLIFTVEADSKGYYFVNNGKYIGRKSSDSSFGNKDTNACWTLSFNDDGTLRMTNGSDGNIAFQFNVSQPRFKNYNGQQDPTIYIKNSASEVAVLKTFVARYLNPTDGDLSDIPSAETGIPGTACLGNSGLYMSAKAALNSNEFAAYCSAFQTSSDSIIVNARLRYEAWARAYGDTTPYSSSLTTSSFNLINLIKNNSTNINSIIIAISVVGLSGLATVLFVKKRKHN